MISVPNPKRLTMVIIGSYPDKIKGSLLRQFNIWHTFKNLKSFQVIYAPLTRHIVHVICRVLLSDVVILSGTGSSIYTSLILLIRKVLRKITLIDFHGSGWYEESIIHESKSARLALKKALTFMFEFVSYRFADCVIVASCMLSYILKKYFGQRENLYVIENSVTPLFEKVVHRLEAVNIAILRKILLNTFRIPSDSYILICPLPVNFASNKLAIETLMRIVDHFDKRTYIVVTGAISEGLETVERVKYTGYISYVKYAALMLVSSGVLLPYPPNAICGGARNKVIEAGYCKKVVLSTRTGMLFTNTKPWVHYYPIDDLLTSRNDISARNISIHENGYNSIAEAFKRYVDTRHSYAKFRYNLLKLLLETLKLRGSRTRRWRF